MGSADVEMTSKEKPSDMISTPRLIGQRLLLSGKEHASEQKVVDSIPAGWFFPLCILSNVFLNASLKVPQECFSYKK